MKKNKVFHTQQERQEFLLTAAMLHFNPPNLEWTKAFFSANKTLQEDRQLGKGTIYTQSKKWRVEAETQYNLLKGKSIPDQPEKMLIWENPPTVEQSKLAQMLDKLANTIIDQLFEKITKGLEEKLKGYKPDNIWTPINVISELQKPKLSPKKRILIVGLLPIQQAEISKQFDSYFRLRFHESDENIHRLEPRVNGADIVILNCTKISHKHQDMVKKFAGNKPVKLVFGGTSAIKGILEGLKVCQTNLQ